METGKIDIAHFQGDVFVKVGEKIAKVELENVQRFIDAIREAERLAKEYRANIKAALLVKEILNAD